LILDATRDDRLADDRCCDLADSVLSRLPVSSSLSAADVLPVLDSEPSEAERGSTHPMDLLRHPG
jgi:hypothetical protein